MSCAVLSRSYVLGAFYLGPLRVPLSLYNAATGAELLIMLLPLAF